jgi:hypothetical protein
VIIATLGTTFCRTDCQPPLMLIIYCRRIVCEVGSCASRCHCHYGGCDTTKYPGLPQFPEFGGLSTHENNPGATPKLPCVCHPDCGVAADCKWTEGREDTVGEMGETLPCRKEGHSGAHHPLWPYLPRGQGIAAATAEPVLGVLLAYRAHQACSTRILHSVLAFPNDT